ncbi:unnamed protein product [Diamesa tonsa]
MSSKTNFLSVISSIQKIRIYETKSTIYLIGCNNRESRFRVMQISRSNDLQILEDPNEYEIKDIRKITGGLKFTKSLSAYGIVGFVRFLEGYYLILVTKRNKIGVIGNHVIYTIKDTTIYRISAESNKNSNPLESKYLKMFMNVDLSSNFYFSYSYDISRTLQYNMAEPKFVGENVNIVEEEPLNWDEPEYSKEEKIYAYRSTSRKKFIWNEYLLKPMENKVLHKDWMLEVIHGFINQSSISIFGLPIYVCLIARRSTKFAGTRFLKRGANLAGDVANEVETEQIVSDGTKMCSFVQIRGSIPSHWSQDISKIAKPPISLDIPDPYAETSGKHFEKLLFQYGAPIVILNLVKKREKRKHESILTTEITNSVKYLNQFLPSNCKIRYNHFDMARKNRSDKNVMESLAVIAESVIQQTGMFYKDNNETVYQTGIIRTNCVDCLDRTNTAQFAMGKCALAHQLYKMGFLRAPPRLEFDSDCITMLESLYEIHGDTLALQYGGSQLVHRIKTYRKTAAWTSQGNDIMQTLSRYYSNTFSDTEKQQSINLFLGYFVPPQNEGEENIWDLPNDYHMHNPMDIVKKSRSNDLTKWYSDIVRKNLPNSTANANKIVMELIRIHTRDLEMIDLYSNYHFTFQMTSLEENIAYQISHFARNFMPTFRTNFSPFEPGKRGSHTKNPSLTGQSSTHSANSSNSSSDNSDSSSDEDEISLSQRGSSANLSRNNDTSGVTEKFRLENILPPSQEVYGFEIQTIQKDSLLKYKNYINIQKKATPQAQSLTKEVRPEKPNLNAKQFQLKALGTYTDSSLEVKPPVVTQHQQYQNYCDLIISQDYDKNYSNLNVLEKYLNFIK